MSVVALDLHLTLLLSSKGLVTGIRDYVEVDDMHGTVVCQHVYFGWMPPNSYSIPEQRPQHAVI